MMQERARPLQNREQGACEDKRSTMKENGGTRIKLYPIMLEILPIQSSQAVAYNSHDLSILAC